MTIRISNHQQYSIGQKIKFYINMNKVSIFDKETGVAIHD